MRETVVDLTLTIGIEQVSRTKVYVSVTEAVAEFLSSFDRRSDMATAQDAFECLLEVSLGWPSGHPPFLVHQGYK